MNRVWKLSVPVAAIAVVIGVAASSLAASGLDDLRQRETIVVDQGAPADTGGQDAGQGTGQDTGQDKGRDRPGKKGESRGDDGRKADDEADDDVAVVRPDVDDLDDPEDDTYERPWTNERERTDE